jgi:hypothetical protein
MRDEIIGMATDYEVKVNYKDLANLGYNCSFDVKILQSVLCGRR